MVTRRLALSSLFNGNKARDTTPLAPPPPLPPPATTTRPAAWPWPSSNSGKNPRAHSRTTVASVALDSADSSSFTASSAAAARQDDDCCSDSLSTTASEASASAAPAAACDDDAVVVRGLRSDRLLFDPPGASATNSILDDKSSSSSAAAEKNKEAEEAAFGGAVAVALESADPYADFRASMEEMVAAHGVGDWGWLERMLGWYLRANDGDTHCAVVAAFIDVVVAIADPARQAQAACASHSQTSTTCTFAGAAGGESLDVAETKDKPPAGVLAVSRLD